MRRFARQALVVLAAMGLSSAAYAQGSIAGVAKDASGGVLPGVTVEASSPVLIEKERSVVTDGSGQYKIVDLRPGTYTVTFALAGFSTVRREGIELTGSFAATVNADMKVGTVAESITVTGASPIVDVQTVAQQRVIGKDVIDAIPAGRNYLDVSVLLPGLSASLPGSGSLMDVGGTNNLKTSTITIHGSSTADTRILVDGLAIRNIGSEGQYSNFVPDTGSTQEVAIDYSSASAESMTSGIVVNHIPREGGNGLKGSFFGTAVNSSFQGDNYTQDLQSRGLTSPNALKNMYDINPSVGGPIVRDTLWFFSSARWQANKSYIAGVFANLNAGNPNAWTYVPDPTNRGVYQTTQASGNTRLTWQATPKNKFNFSYDGQGRLWDDERAAVSPEAITKYRFTQQWIAQAGWSAALTNRLLLDAKVSNHAEVWHFLVDPNSPLIPVQEQSSGLLYRETGLGNVSPCCLKGYEMPHILNVSASLSYVTGTHAFKVGFADISGTVTNSDHWISSNLSYRLNNGIPNQLTEYGTPSTQVTNLNAELGVYAQDKWTLKRFTINAGVRFDYFNTGFPQQQLGPTTFTPTRNITFDAGTWYDLKDVTPRFGVAYDVFGNGKTALKVNLGKYIQAVNPIVGNPVANLALLVTRSWTDANRDFVPDCNLLNTQTNGECGTISDLTFGGVKPSTAYDPASLAGWGKRPYNWEFSTNLQHELLPRLALNVGYFRRWFGNFIVTDNLSVAASDFSPFSIQSPVDPKLPGGGANVISNLDNLNPNKVGLVNNYVTFASDYGTQIQHWNGLDVTLSARLKEGVLLQGGVSGGRTSTDNCAVLGQLPEISPVGIPYCHVDTAFLTQVKMLATYTVPKVDVRVAATFQSFPGPQVAANYLATNAQVQPTLGRPLSGGATNVTVNLVAPGTVYGERANQLDLRFTKLLRLGRTRFGVNLDLANALNGNAVLTQNNNYATWQVPQSIVDARLAKLSVQIDF